MSDFDRLHPAVQYHVVNSLGWTDLRPLQREAVAPLLEGRHALLLAPTAAGKTEAAALPLFSRMLSEDWQGLSVLYLCPLRALLNNLEPRLERFASLLGRRVGLWHGDVRASIKNKLRREPPDFLLTTPESLEGMLVSPTLDRSFFLGAVRAVVVDEIHAFAGDDRGWHLLGLLQRLRQMLGEQVQRVGLSATVGNPRELLGWLTAGCDLEGVILDPADPDSGEKEIVLDHVGSLDNAAHVISRLHGGEKRLVFCDSRASGLPIDREGEYSQFRFVSSGSRTFVVENPFPLNRNWCSRPMVSCTVSPLRMYVWLSGSDAEANGAWASATVSAISPTSSPAAIWRSPGR